METNNLLPIWSNLLIDSSTKQKNVLKKNLKRNVLKKLNKLREGIITL
jgi:hypothetical protein